MSTFINVNLIDPDPEQPRKNKPVSYLRDELAVSIAHEGLNNPIHVRENTDIPGRFWIVNGECRWTAISMFVKDHWDGKDRDGFKIEDGKIFIECQVKNLKSAGDVFKNQILDNVVRLNMGPLETLQSIHKAIYEHGISLEACGKAFGIGSATIEADLPILELPELMLKEFDKGNLSKVVARKIAELPANQREKAYEWAKNARNAEGALKKIQAYMDKVNQMDLFDQMAESADSTEKKEAKIAWSKLQKSIENISGSPYMNGKAKLLILTHSRELATIEQTAKEMKKISDHLLETLAEYKARKKSAVA